jgi:hypothetical protein
MYIYVVINVCSLFYFFYKKIEQLLSDKSRVDLALTYLCTHTRTLHTYVLVAKAVFIEFGSHFNISEQMNS